MFSIILFHLSYFIIIIFINILMHFTVILLPLFWISNEIVNYINTMSCPFKVNGNTIKLKVNTSCYCVLDLLCVKWASNWILTQECFLFSHFSLFAACIQFVLKQLQIFFHSFRWDGIADRVVGKQRSYVISEPQTEIWKKISLKQNNLAYWPNKIQMSLKWNEKMLRKKMI